MNDFIKCEKPEGDCPCEDCSDQDVPMAEIPAGPTSDQPSNVREQTLSQTPGQYGYILKPGQDPRTLGLEGKARAEKCLEAIKLVLEQFDCNLEGVAIIKNGSVQTAINCSPVQRLTEEQQAATAAAKAVQ